MSVYNTEYKRGQYVLLPNSTNEKPLFGKIFKLLCCEQGRYGYLYYQKTSNTYRPDTDLFIVTDCNQFGIIATDQLADYHTIEVERALLSIKF